MKINFDEMRIYTSLDKKDGVVQSLRKDFANLIYTQGRGIEAHALALKIYNGNADTEFNEQEVIMIRDFSKACAPCIIDAFERILP
ncbi:MAG: hypothetical protein IJ640_09350 [Prevotella sp.]|nr:hypothetical protein [Prevotella sp.]